MCKPEELLTIRGFLMPHASAVAPGLWEVLDSKADAGKRVRAACALAGLAPNDPQWADVAEAVAKLVSNENPLTASVWEEALVPVRGVLAAEVVHDLHLRAPQLRVPHVVGQLQVADIGAVLPPGSADVRTKPVRTTTTRDG